MYLLHLLFWTVSCCLILSLYVCMLLGNSGVWGLKKNFALLELLERLQYTHERATILYTADVLEKERQVLYMQISHLCISVYFSSYFSKTTPSVTHAPYKRFNKLHSH